MEITRRWRERRSVARRHREVGRALDQATTPIMEAELRAIVAAQFNR